MVRLTPAGDVIYKDAKFCLTFQTLDRKCKAAMNNHNKTFRVGTSLLIPPNHLWIYGIRSTGIPDYKLHLVPFEDNHEGILTEIAQLGQNLTFSLQYAIQNSGWINVLCCRLGDTKICVQSPAATLLQKNA